MKVFVISLVLSWVLPLTVMAANGPVPSTSWNEHFKLYLLLMAGIWLLVTTLLLYFVFKYRRKKREREDGAYIEGNTLLEIVWTIVPLVIVLLLGVQTWAVYKEYRTVPKDVYEVNVEGFMWGWNITYPEGIKTTNELRVPVGQPVKVNITSRDVLHSFFIPEYRVQEEAIPGRTTYFWFRPTRVGQTRAFCTEFCGNGHSLMLAKLIVMEKDEFQQWIAKTKEVIPLSPLEKGKKLVADLGCLGCHTLTGEKSTGPTFKGLFDSERVLTDGKRVRADEEYIGHSIIEPSREIVQGYSNIMQPYKLSEEDTHAITEYIKTLK